MPNYSIEARSYSIPGLPASHDFWVLRNSDTGLEIAELHGLATDRATGEVVTIGTDDKLFSLNVWHFVHDTQYALELNVPVEDRTLIRQGQTSEIVFSGTFEEVLVRWNTAVNAIDLLNRLDLDYPAYGFKIFGDTINSNSAYRTLGEIMGITPYDFPGVVEPGFDNRMLPAEVVDSLKYKANGLSLVDWTNVFAAADDTGGLSTDLFTSIPNTIPGTILDTPDNPIQSVSSSGNLIQADATITVTGVTGYDVNAVSGNQQAANAIIGDDYRPGASEILYFDDWGVGSDAYSGADVGAYTNSQATGAT